MKQCIMCGKEIVDDLNKEEGFCHECTNKRLILEAQRTAFNLELEQKDHRIAVLEKALELACREHKIFGYCCYANANCDKTVLSCEECCAEYFIKQAEKELEEQKK